MHKSSGLRGPNWQLFFAIPVSAGYKSNRHKAQGASKKAPCHELLNEILL